MVSRIYDRVADRYDEDWSGLYASARRYCIEQIGRQLSHRDRPVDILDLGIGTGNTLHELRATIALGRCAGFDLSAGMLDQAADKLADQVQLIQGNAIEAADYLPPGSMDLVLCHFILSFVDADRLFETAFEMLRPGAVLSLATSTRRSLRETHSGRFSRAARILGVQRALNAATTPADHDHCLESLHSHGFEIVDDRLHRQAVRFTRFEDVRSWALDSGWAASLLDDKTGIRIALGRAAFGLAKVFMHPFYPVDAVSEISIVLARKPATSDSRDSRLEEQRNYSSGSHQGARDRDSSHPSFQSR